MRSVSQLVASHLLYVVAAAGFGVVWMFANPEFWKRSDRNATTYLVYIGASLAVALLLRGRIQSASGWKVWALAVLVSVMGHFLVNWGLMTVDALREGMSPFAGESWLDGALKRYVILPAVFLIMTVYLLPVYVPIGAGYVFVLRSIGRATAASTEAARSTPTLGASGTTPLDEHERTLASAVRESSAVVVAKAESPFIVQGEKAVAKGPPYRWNILRFRIVEVLKGDPGLPPQGETLTVSLYDENHFFLHRAYHEHGVSATPATDPADAPYPTSVERIEREARGGVILFLAPCAKTRHGERDGYCFVHPRSFDALAKLDEVKRTLQHLK